MDVFEKILSESVFRFTLFILKIKENVTLSRVFKIFGNFDKGSERFRDTRVDISIQLITY